MGTEKRGKKKNENNSTPMGVQGEKKSGVKIHWGKKTLMALTKN